MKVNRHKNGFPVTRFRSGVIQSGLFLAVLYIISRYDYLLFHSLIEFFGAAIGIAVFLLAWNARKYTRNNFYLFLGTALATVGIIRIIHALAYRGMGVISGTAADANLATQLWIASQFILSISFVIAPLLLRRKIRTSLVILGYSVVFSLTLLSIFYWKNFPTAYIEGSGLTNFKKNSEYLAALLFLLSAYLFYQRRQLLDKRATKIIFFVIGMFFLSTLSFTQYVGVYSFSNEIGHLLSFLGFYGSYLAIVELGLMKPYNLIFEELKQSERRYREIADSALVGIYRTDLEGNYLYINEAMAKMFEFDSPEEMMREGGKMRYDKLEDREKFHDSLRKKGRLTNYELAGRTKSGKKIFILSSAVLTDTGRTGMILNITERKLAEESLRQSEENLKLTVEASGGAPWHIELDPKYPDKLPDELYLSLQSKKIIGFDDSEFPNSLSAWQNRIPLEDLRALRQSMLDHLAKKSGFHKMDYRIRHKDGSLRWIYTCGKIIRDENGIPQRWSGMDFDVTEAKEREIAINEQKRKYQSLFSNMIDGFAYHKMIFDKNGAPCDYVFLEVNRSFENLTGLRREQIIGKKVTDVIPGIEKDPVGWIGKYGRVVTLGENASFESYSEQLKKWFSISAYSPQKDHFVAIFEDITARKRGEDAIRRSKEEWERTFDSVPDLIAILDDRYRITRVNHAMAERLKAKKEKCVGLQCFSCVHNSKKPVANCPHALTLADGKEHIAEVEEKNLGGTFLVSTTPFFGDNGKLLGSVHVARDITERKKAEQALKKGEEKLRETAELLNLVTKGTGVVIASVDKNFRYTYFNHAYKEEIRRLTGKNIELGANMLDYFAEMPEQRKIVEREWSRPLMGKSTNKTIEFGDPNHYRRSYNILHTPLIDSGGNIIGAGEVAIDATKRMEIEKAKDEFISLASHQLRTPLASIGLSSELLLRGTGGKVDPEQREYLGEIYKSIKKMTLLVNNLLNVSRVEMGNFEVKTEQLAISEGIENTMRDFLSLFNEKSLRLKAKIEKDLSIQNFDANSFNIIFQNLLSNAIRYTPKSGSILVSLKKNPEGILLSVSDTGIGISKKDANKIFSKSFRAENAKKKTSEGAGLGLYMSRIAAEKGGAKIWFEPENGKGSTFFVLFPK